MVRNVTFENVTINGEKMRDLKETVTNEFISNVSVKEPKLNRQIMVHLSSLVTFDFN